MAEIRGFSLLRLASNRVFSLDDFTRKGDATAALCLAAERSIGSGRAARTAPRSVANLAFTNGIADTDDHERLPLLRVVRYTACNRFAIVIWGSAQFTAGKRGWRY